VQRPVENKLQPKFMVLELHRKGITLICAMCILISSSVIVSIFAQWKQIKPFIWSKILVVSVQKLHLFLLLTYYIYIKIIGVVLNQCFHPNICFYMYIL